MKRSKLQRGRAWFGTLLSLFLICLTAKSALAADRIVLRSLDSITDRSVASFNEDGVQLDDGSQLGWHEIDRVRLTDKLADKQAEFNQLLEELGGRLFPISKRLGVGDFKDVLLPAESLYPRYKQRRSRTAYMVLQALMWAKLAAGDRVGALEPYLRCYELLRGGRVSANELPGQRRLQFDLKTGLTSELTPIWFDGDAARASMPSIHRTIAGMDRPLPPGALIYYAALALAAGDEDMADKMLGWIKSREAPILELKQILAAQREVVAGRSGPAISQLSSRLERISRDHRPLALYWLGMSKLGRDAAGSHEAGLLELLRIPATYGQEHPDLAAAALFRTMHVLRKSGDALSSAAVRNELLLRYGQTSFANQVQSQGSDDTP